jgi:hypothetical protein
MTWQRGQGSDCVGVLAARFFLSVAIPRNEISQIKMSEVWWPN